MEEEEQEEEGESRGSRRSSSPQACPILSSHLSMHSGDTGPNVSENPFELHLTKTSEVLGTIFFCCFVSYTNNMSSQNILIVKLESDP